MKNIAGFFTIISFLTLSFQSKAQDTLLMTNGSRIASKVLEVNTAEVKYKKADNPDGPTFVTSKVDVAFIKYMNGTTDTLNSIKSKVVMKPIDKGTPKLYKAGTKYMFGDERISENQMFNKMLSLNDPVIAAHVRKAKTGKAIQYVGFLGIPTLAGGVGYLIYTGLSTTDLFSTPDRNPDFTPGIALAAAGVVCLTTSTIFKISYKKHAAEAVKLYNQKY